MVVPGFWMEPRCANIVSSSEVVSSLATWMKKPRTATFPEPSVAQRNYESWKMTAKKVGKPAAEKTKCISAS